MEREVFDLVIKTLLTNNFSMRNKLIFTSDRVLTGTKIEFFQFNVCTFTIRIIGQFKFRDGKTYDRIYCTFNRLPEKRKWKLLNMNKEHLISESDAFTLLSDFFNQFKISWIDINVSLQEEVIKSI